MNENCGVYLIRCSLSDKVYVGSSIHIEHRLAVHRRALASGKHVNRKLQAAWNKHGSESFSFFPLIRCQPNARLLYEQRALDVYRAVDEGYNLARDVSAPMLGFVVSQETRAKLSKAHKGKVFSEATRAALKRSAQARSDAVSAQMKEMWKTRPREIVDKIAASNTGKKRSEEGCKRIGEATKMKWQKPEFREKMLVVLVRARESLDDPVVRAKQSANMKARMADPAQKAKVVAVHKGRKNTQETIEKMRKAALSRSPETREKYRLAALAREENKRQAKQQTDPD